MDALSKTVDGIRSKDQQYRTEVSEIRKLISDIRLKLQQAKRDIQQAVSISLLCFYGCYFINISAVNRLNKFFLQLIAIDRM